MTDVKLIEAIEWLGPRHVYAKPSPRLDAMPSPEPRVPWYLDEELDVVPAWLPVTKESFHED